VKKVAKKAYAVTMLSWALVGLATPTVTDVDNYKSAANIINSQKKEVLQIAKGRT
jgi:hypothetical protein